jgi:hypothetical protein
MWDAATIQGKKAVCSDLIDFQPPLVGSFVKSDITTTIIQADKKQESGNANTKPK